jgi:hypothetical protein
VRAHDRGAHRAWLAGDGTLSLDTDPSGAEVTLYRSVTRDRVRTPEPIGPLGRTPLRRVRVPWGSPLLRIEGPSGSVDLPIWVGRAEDWANVPHGGEPSPLWLPRPGELGPDDCYVPAGWFRAGGDPEAGDPLPAGRWWSDGFVIHWCANAYTSAGPGGVGGRPALDREEPAIAAVRGGAFNASRGHCRLATRFGAPPGRRYGVCGFRLCRTFP